MKKKIISALVIVSLFCSLTGCAQATSQSPAKENTEAKVEATEATDDTAKNNEEVVEEKTEESDETQAEELKDEAVDEAAEEETEVVAEDAEEETTVDETVETEEVEEVEEVVDLDTISSPEFAKLLKFGWNLGNTLDANATGGLESETCWGQPKVTPELIAYIKEVGFTSIRIPVSWGKHTDENYNIDPEWMARVKEIVDYAYDEGLYVIINSHHDNDYYYPSEENMDNAKKYIAAIWSQVSEEFKDYDYHLVFESMNEPRLSGTSIEWWFAMSDLEGKAAIKRIVELNQVFVDTVRSSESYNLNRFLLVPSYAANPDYALFNEFTMPEDPANRMMLSAHAYTPYEFAGSGTGYSEWDGSKTSDFIFMGKLNSKFIINGYGVVIGEFGATNKNNEKDRCSWARGYCMKAASFGISYFVWDNGAIGVGEENFGVIDRTNLKLYFPDLFEAYKCGYPD